eukprot:557773-Pleurochrysis_carterae.AAC.1
MIEVAVNGVGAGQRDEGEVRVAVEIASVARGPYRSYKARVVMPSRRATDAELVVQPRYRRHACVTEEG